MRKNAFTLIELLLAAAISSVIIVVVYSVFQGSITSYNKIESSSVVYQTARAIFNRLELDLKNAYSFADDDAKFQGAKKSLDFFSLAASFENGGEFVYPARVKYDFTGESLTRSCAKGWNAIEGDVQEEELSDQAVDFSLQYAFKADDSSSTVEWLDSWPPQSQGSTASTRLLPQAVKIKLTIIEKNKQGKQASNVEFTKEVPLYFNLKTKGKV